MKNLSKKLFLSVCLLTMTISAFAQFANTGSSASASTSSTGADTRGWERLFISYNPVTAVVDAKGVDDMDFTGFSLGYANGFSITEAFPLFLETGISALYATHTDDVDEDFEDFELKTTVLSAIVPANLVYKFALPNTNNVAILPYAGLYFRGNIIGKSKINFTGDAEDYGFDSEDDLWDALEDEGLDRETNWFDKDEAGGKDSQWNRFQVGWQIGVGVSANQFYAGVSYGKDLNELSKKVKIATTSITIGYNF